MSVLQKQYGVIVQVYVESVIVGALQVIKAGKQIGIDQAPAIAKLIMDTYYWYKPEDIQLCFKMGIMGKFGKNYDVFDAQTIMMWFEQYEAMRYEEKRNSTDHKVDGSKNIIQQLVSLPEVSKIVSDVASKLKVEEIRTDNTKREFDPVMDRLHDEYVKLRGSATFAVYNGETVDFTGFLKLKLKEANDEENNLHTLKK